MKVAVSIPDAVFDSAERACKRLRVSRSRFYAQAVAAHVRQQSGEEVTRRLNQVCSRLSPELDEALASLSLEVLRGEKW